MTLSGRGDEPEVTIEKSEVEELYERLAPVVYSLALADTNSEAEAEDYVQVALLSYLEARTAGRHIANPDAWVLRVTTNALKRCGRQRRMWHLIARPPDVATSADIADKFVSNRAPAVRALLRLGDDDRRCIALYRLAGRSDSAAAAIAGTSAQNIRQRLVRAWGRLAELYLEELLGREPRSRACLRPWSLLPRAVAGKLSPSQRERLTPHLAACPACRRAHDDLRRYWNEGLTALLPLRPAPEAKERIAGRLVAAVEDRPPDRVARSRALRRRSIAVWLLPLVVLLLPGPAPAPAVNQPAGLVVQGQAIRSEPALSAGVPPPPSAVARASPSPGQSPEGRPAAKGSPCPVMGPSAGYAYLDAGDLYYRPRIGLSPERLTITGGRVDAFWWSPDGQSLAYKVQARPPDIAGDIHLISLDRANQTWQFGSAVDYFAFSPDGSRYAVATRVLDGGSWSAEDVRIGSFSQPSSTAADWRLPLPRGAGQPADLDETPGLPQSAFDPLQGLFWPGSTVDFSVPDLYDSLNPTTGAVAVSLPDTAAVENSWFDVSPRARFTMNWDTGELGRLCGGALAAETPAALGGRADFVSLSADGGTALLTLNDGGADVVSLLPDGTLHRLSSDGLSSGARWRP